jgi:hypothetical protein
VSCKDKNQKAAVSEDIQTVIIDSMKAVAVKQQIIDSMKIVSETEKNEARAKEVVIIRDRQPIATGTTTTTKTRKKWSGAAKGVIIFCTMIKLKIVLIKIKVLHNFIV